jgi:hypothetical protein
MRQQLSPECFDVAVDAGYLIVPMIGIEWHGLECAINVTRQVDGLCRGAIAGLKRAKVIMRNGD